MAIRSFRVSRRSFAKSCLATAAATGLPVWFLERDAALAAPAPKILGPNDRPGIALVGCGGQGSGDAANASRFGDILAVCDVDQGHAAGAAKRFAKNGKTPDTCGDFRKVMEREEFTGEGARAANQRVAREMRQPYDYSYAR